MVKIKINYGSDYYAMDNGRIYSSKTNKVLKHRIDKKGYYIVNLSINGKCKTFQEHRLIAEAFVENPNNYPVVNHLDGIKVNNVPSNLEWTTFSGNTRHAIKNGLQKPSPKSGFKKKLTNKDADRIRDLYRGGGLSYNNIAEMFGVTKHAILQIVKGVTHKTKKSISYQSFNKPKGKLPFETVGQIKSMLRDGISTYEVGRRLDIPVGTIKAIKYGKTYTYVDENGNIDIKKYHEVVGSKRRCLTEEDINSIFRYYYIENLSFNTISELYSVGRSAVVNVILGLSYKEITSKLVEEYKNYR